jgi:hypothetical protein
MGIQVRKVPVNLKLEGELQVARRAGTMTWAEISQNM